MGRPVNISTPDDLPSDLRPIHMLPVAVQMLGRRKVMYRSTIGDFVPYVRLFPNAEPMWSLSAVKKFLEDKKEENKVPRVFDDYQKALDRLNREEEG